MLKKLLERRQGTRPTPVPGGSFAYSTETGVTVFNNGQSTHHPFDTPIRGRPERMNSEVDDGTSFEVFSDENQTSTGILLPKPCRRQGTCTRELALRGVVDLEVKMVIQKVTPHGMYVIVGATEPAYIRFRHLLESNESNESYLLARMDVTYVYDHPLLTIDFAALRQPAVRFWKTRKEHICVNGKLIRLRYVSRNNWELIQN